MLLHFTLRNVEVNPSNYRATHIRRGSSKWGGAQSERSSHTRPQMKLFVSDLTGIGNRSEEVIN